MTKTGISGFDGMEKLKSLAGTPEKKIQKTCQTRLPGPHKTGVFAYQIVFYGVFAYQIVFYGVFAYQIVFCFSHKTGVFAYHYAVLVSHLLTILLTNRIYPIPL